MSFTYIDAYVVHSKVFFPSINQNGKISSKEKNYWQHKFSTDFSLPFINTLSLSWNRYLGGFPLGKIIQGNTLTDFQSIYLTAEQSISPYYNSNYSITTSNNLGVRTDWRLAYLHGVSENLNSQQVKNGIVYKVAQQLQTNYHLLSTKVRTHLPKLTIEVTPELILSSSEFLNNQKISKASTHTYLTSLLFHYNIKGKFQVAYSPKYTHFIFKNNASTSEKVFNFFTQNIALTNLFFQEKLQTKLTYLNLLNLSPQGSFNHLNLTVTYQGKNIKFQTDFYNILDAKTFITQTQDHNLRYFTTSEVFHRYVNFSLSFKINARK